ncbi:EamA/RhaT family transporter, partial [Pantoea dispersa]
MSSGTTPTTDRGDNAPMPNSRSNAAAAAWMIAAVAFFSLMD